MIVYRISKGKYIKDLSGTGAKLYGGRWNPKGYAMLYTSINRSLAALEYLVHVDPRSIPSNLKILSIELPKNSILNYDEKKFLRISRKKNSSILFKEEGMKWIESDKSLMLEVPSMIIPQEKNILINTQHKLMSKVKVNSIEKFEFEDRFFV